MSPRYWAQEVDCRFATLSDGQLPVHSFVLCRSFPICSFWSSIAAASGQARCLTVTRVESMTPNGSFQGIRIRDSASISE